MNISSSQRSTLIELAIFLAIILTSWADDMIPYFTEEPMSAVLSQNSPVTLSCSVHPSSSVVRWKCNDQYLDANNSYGIKLIGTDLLVSSLPEGGDSATFQCTAQNRRGTIISKTAKVAKAVLRKFEDRDDLHLNVTEGSNLVLPCQPPYSRPLAKIMFKYNGTTTIDTSTDHYKILPSGNLQILGVTSQDRGQYQCMAENTHRNRTRTAKYIIHLNVLNTEFPSQEPAVIMPTAKQQASVGDNVVLECSAVGNPQPVITWEKYGGKLLSGRYSQQFGNLYLKNVTQEDEGTYLCKADNGLNSLMLDGLKAMLLEISEPPKVISERESVNVSLGGHIELGCKIMGKPEPQTTWWHNGHLLKAFTGDNKLVIRSAKGSSHGLYQCFAENEAGTAYVTMEVNVDVTRQDTGSLALSDQNVTKTPPSATSVKDNKTPAGQDSNRRRHRKKQNRKKNNKRRDRKEGNTKKNSEKIKLVPPNKPEVKQLSDTSVMLNWTVPANEGLKITFFRVQYKRVGPNKGNWKTEDIEIGSHIRMYEVRGLKPRATYKFRIAAVFSNNDNAHGPNSDRFEMKAATEPESKPPSNQPIIVEVTAIDFQNIHALNIKWQHNTVTSSPIEGFYIYYKPYHAEKDPFLNVTLLEPSVRAHLLTNLLSGTAYLIRMQSFNAAGKSPPSNEVVEITKGPPGQWDPHIPKPNGTTMSPPTPTKTYTEEEHKPIKTGTQSSSEMLYMILGIVLGVMMLFLIVFLFMCWWKQRQQRLMMVAMNDAVRNKFQDPSQRIYADSLRKKMMNGGLNGINGTIANGHIPRNFHKMNINVNPLSEFDAQNSTDGSNHYTPTSFHPNGTLPGHHRASDNNCNNINQSKSLENSLQHLNHNSNPSSGDADTLGGGESLANPPSPVVQCKSVPIGHNSDAQERRSISSRSCDHMSCDPCDSSLSYDDTGGVQSGRHRKRRRRQGKEQQTTKDQATNTDLSSNDGTMDLAEYNKAISSSQDSGQMADNSRTFTPNSDNHVLVPSANAV